MKPAVFCLFILRKLSESAHFKTKGTFNVVLTANSSTQDYLTANEAFEIPFFFFFHSPMQAEKKKAGSGDDGHVNPEIERLRKEVQDTKEINKKMRELLQVFSKINPFASVMNN